MKPQLVDYPSEMELNTPAVEKLVLELVKLGLRGIQTPEETNKNLRAIRDKVTEIILKVKFCLRNDGFPPIWASYAQELQKINTLKAEEKNVNLITFY